MCAGSAFASATSASDGPVLSGDVAEGGLVIGKTEPGAIVTLDGKAVATDPDGNFLLGFGRDAAGAVSLDVTLPDGRRQHVSLAVRDREFQIERIDGLPERKVTPKPEDVARIKAEREELNAARAVADPMPAFLGGFVWPAKGRISGVYGSQRILNGKPRNPHYGTDIAAPEGTRVRAMAAGRVAFTHPGMFFNGKTVLVDHGLGLRSIYIHMSDVSVKPGQMVAAGQDIGAVGKTGRATGAHLHFGVTLDTTPLDPELILKDAPR